MAARKNKAESFLNRELSWLAFSRRVLALAESAETPLLERIKFTGIVGMLHDEFFVKRISGLKRQIEKVSRKTTLDGRSPREVFDACRAELVEHCDLPAVRTSVRWKHWRRCAKSYSDRLRKTSGS